MRSPLHEIETVAVIPDRELRAGADRTNDQHEHVPAKYVKGAFDFRAERYQSAAKIEDRIGAAADDAERATLIRSHERGAQGLRCFALGSISGIERSPRPLMRINSDPVATSPRGGVIYFRRIAVLLSARNALIGNRSASAGFAANHLN